MTNFINFLIYQIGWLGAALSASSAMSLLSALCCVAALLIHLWVVEQSERGRELRLAGFALVLGAVWESTLNLTGVVAYAGDGGGIAPLWIITMWPLFALTLNYSLAWMHGKFMVAVLLGAIGGPAAFYGGQKLGAVELLLGWPSLLILGLGWAVLFPLLQFLARFPFENTVKAESVQ
ncbi:DUF2878 domain-containing protein [Spongiibacter sp. KMU-158]|uniref:DUF2878 domain-containing protein n=1 Tax=Spongiibacter pelagi TaxID=2760804 RepID=A0A927GWH5_9GAMM|nr:DUF2878 domain-containing protein [Spongiibacter pelagi]MBD2859460.1 DUF2878 domain-containing protein [Spongiibacter pelagi]